jgi:hypothetical protein
MAPASAKAAVRRVVIVANPSTDERWLPKPPTPHRLSLPPVPYFSAATASSSSGPYFSAKVLRSGSSTSLLEPCGVDLLDHLDAGLLQAGDDLGDLLRVEVALVGGGLARGLQEDRLVLRRQGLVLGLVHHEDERASRRGGSG